MDEGADHVQIEDALAGMLHRVRGIPFTTIIKSLSGYDVLKFNAGDAADAALLARLTAAVKLTIAEVNASPILRPRPNEVGNDIETYVMRALSEVGLRALRPTCADGHAKSTGYPDILVYDAENRPTYIECKIFEHGKPMTTMRSFYLSPSQSFKVCQSARHLLLAFGMSAQPVAGSREALYLPKSFKLVDLHDLMCDVKHEFNSDNRRLYAPGMTLLDGMA